MNIQMTSLDERIVAAGRALKLGRYDAAKSLYDELYALNPRDARVLMGRTILFQKLEVWPRYFDLWGGSCYLSW